MLSFRSGFAAAIASAALLTLAVGAPARAAEDEELGSLLDSVRQDLQGDRLDLVGVKTTGGRGSGSNVVPAIGLDNYTPPPPPPSAFEVCLDAWEKNRSCYAPLEPSEPGEEPADPVEIPPITITDLASFAPNGSILTGEPDNLGVAGLPTNFVATGQQHTQNGTLFGFPIAVRFTPASFTFHFGDGQTLTSDTGGQSWDTLNLPQFSPTDTSHTYTERGTYTARADVNYTAEIDLGVGWFPISGQLITTGPDQSIRIYEAHTALVAHTCTEKPDAPGC